MSIINVRQKTWENKGGQKQPMKMKTRQKTAVKKNQNKTEQNCKTESKRQNNVKHIEEK